jgi:hypothetical protein
MEVSVQCFKEGVLANNVRQSSIGTPVNETRVIFGERKEYFGMSQDSK